MRALLDVLVADDEPKIRRLLERILIGEGCAVRLAQDGLEALSQFRQQPADVVFTDLKMPKLTGVELLGELKSLEPLANVVVITAYPSVEGAVEAMKIGACDFLTKPFNLVQIRAILYRCQQRLSLHQQLRSAGEGLVKLEELNRRLAEVNELKDHFLASLSHEVNTPLCLIGEWVALLADGTLGKLTSDQQGAVEALAGASDRLRRLLEQLIDLTQGHQIVLRRQATSAQSLIRQAVEAVRPKAASRAITIACRLPASLVPLEVDRDRCAAALEHVLDNAVKFNRDGGRVEIEAADTPQTVRVRVSDTGIGISPEEQEKVFEPFYQVDRKLNRAYGGTGIGLTMARRYVELHGGALTLTSEAGAGTTVVMALPRHAPPLPGPAGAPSGSSD